MAISRSASQNSWSALWLLGPLPSKAQSTAIINLNKRIDSIFRYSVRNKSELCSEILRTLGDISVDLITDLLKDDKIDEKTWRPRWEDAQGLGGLYFPRKNGHGNLVN
jgi:hypothetical protein